METQTETTAMKLNQYEWNPALDILGKGAFAEVFRAKDHKGNNVALKIYKEAIITGSTGGSSSGKYTLEREYEKGKLLSHTNVIRYLDFDYIKYLDAMQREAKYPVLIMEYADEGSLSGWLKSTTTPTVEESLKIIRGILNGLTYLHEQGIIHRDLKPANILFRKDRLGNKVVKISDFGISRDLLEDNTGRPSATAGVGTVDYMAPEQLLKKTYGLNGEISSRTDLWAVGVILYKMLSGKMPFGDADQSYENTHDEIINKESDYSKIPAKYQPVIKACLQKYASARPADAHAVIDLLDAAQKKQPEHDTTLDDKERTQIKPDPFKDKRKVVPVPPKPSSVGKYIVIAAAVILVIVLVVKFGMGPRSVTDKVFKDSDSLEYTYTGVVNKDGRPDGIGKAIYNKTKLSVSGAFKNGDATGVDTLIYNTNDKYIGDVFNGRRNGQGTYYSASNEIYKGGWISDKRNGEGFDTLANGDKYHGNFSDGKRDGQGTFVSHTGETYQGNWKNDLKSGKGTWITDNGDKYAGDFNIGLPNGRDTVTFSNGDIYIGDVVFKNITGEGTKYFKRNDKFKGDMYTGGFIGGNFYGHGVYTWHNGASYDGQWKNNLRDGAGGTYTDESGIKYDQNWQNGKQVTN
ncbi:MAG TPA: protein kinase [Mucilaginibacter sp.]|jgi:serine/threonine protein kinase|nr:protein kinase [Mucilaginibacter sp.]